MYTRKEYATREAPWRGQSKDQAEAREGQAGRFGVAEGFVVPVKLGNAGGGCVVWARLKKLLIHVIPSFAVEYLTHEYNFAESR